MISQLFHDADALLYTNACAAQQTHYQLYFKRDKIDETVFRYKKDYNTWLKDQPENLRPFYSVEPIEHLLDVNIAYASIDKAIWTARKVTGAKRMFFYLTDENKSNFRYQLASIIPYKYQRQEKEKPKYYYDCLQYILDRWNGEIIYGEEADDAVCQAQMPYYQRLMGESYTDMDVTCIAHKDKDINMVPGFHYNYTTNVVYWVSELDGLRFFYTQLLTGDKSVDNIPGLYHVTGEKAKKAYKDKIQACQTEKEMFDTVFQLYDKHAPKQMHLQDSDGDVVTVDYPGTMQIIIEIGNLLWMRRAKGEWWQPPV